MKQCLNSSTRNVETEEPSVSSHKYQVARDVFSLTFDMTSKLAGSGLCTQQDAARAAIAAAQEASGIQFSAIEKLVGFSHSPVEQRSTIDDYLTVTELGKLVNPPMLPPDMNNFLAKHGYQIRNQNGAWIPTPAKAKYAMRNVSGKLMPATEDLNSFKYSTKWSREVVPTIQDLRAREAAKYFGRKQ